MDDDDIQRLVDIEEIRQLKARYFRYLDTKEWSAWRTLFTEDIHFDHDPTLGKAFDVDAFGDDGRDALVGFVSKTMEGTTSVHRGYTSEITITGPDTATGIWSMSDYVTFPSEGAPMGFQGYGHYHDEYVRTAEGWRIKRSRHPRLRLDVLEGGLPVSLPPTSEQ
jgi:hypothetical protein